MSKKIYIPGRIQNAAVDNEGNRLPVTGAEDIDAGDGKSQQRVNGEVNEALILHQQEINALDSQNYVTVNYYLALPTIGEIDTIYRVSSYDGTQMDTTKYAEYAWNGSRYILLSVKSQVGEVFNISQYRAVGGILAAFDDLADALDGGDNVPVGLRQGGMSVKFVRSSDNKYVQYRLMANTFSTTENDWQGVDDEPTDGSHNLVESGSIKNVLNKVVPSHFVCAVGSNVFRHDFINSHSYIIQNNTSESIAIILGDNSNLDNRQNLGNVGAGETKEFTVDNNYTYQYLYIYSNEANSDAVVLYDKNYYIEEIKSLHQKDDELDGCLEYRINIPFELKSGKFYDLDANNTITEVNNAASKYLERIDVSSYIGNYIVIQLSNFSTTTSSRIIAIGDSNNIASHYLTEGNPTNVEGSIAQYVMLIDSPYLFISFRSECILDYIKLFSTNVGKAVEDLYDKINEVREESVQDSDIEIDIISNNIFNSDNLHRDALVGNDGDIASAEGWQYALIEVESGQTITFGRFSLGRNGYYAFYNGETSSSTLVSVSTFDDPDGGVAATVTVPNGAKYLCIDIVSPATIGGESPLFTANYGTTLKPYDEYSEAITKINGVKLVGVESEGTSMSSLVVDLPVSDGTGIESGYAYIDSTDRTVKVKE